MTGEPRRRGDDAPAASTPAVEGWGSGPARTTQTIRVALIEDHNLVREGLRLVLMAHPGIEVVGEAASAGAAHDLLRLATPDVALVDVTLPDGDGIPLVRSLLSQQPSLRVVVLTMHRDAETVRQALLAGARGYVVKGAHADELVEAVRAVMRGERYLHSSVTDVVVEDSLRWLNSADQLSGREREILVLLAAGNSAPEVGRLLGISTHTVRRHIANMSGKLAVRGIPGLVRYAATHGYAREEGR